MDFEVSIDEHANAYSVVAVRGEVDLHTAPKVQYAIERALGTDRETTGETTGEAGAGTNGGTNGETDGVGTIVVDMSGVAFIDSTALSSLVRSKDTLERQGVSLRLAAPSGAVERIFSVTGFRDYFDVFPSREAALSN